MSQKTICIDPILEQLRAREDNPEDLPPLTTGDFIRMLEEAEDINATDTNVGDTISRQAAIKHFRIIKDSVAETDSKYDEGFIDGLDYCISYISTLGPDEERT